MCESKPLGQIKIVLRADETKRNKIGTSFPLRLNRINIQ